MKSQSVEEDEEDEEDEENTCCDRATFCSRKIRSTIVTKPISRFLGKRITWATAFWLVTSTGIILFIWMVLYFFLGDTMIPNGAGFKFYLLIVFSYSLGWSLTILPYLCLPPVFGMLAAGLILRNSGFYDINKEIGFGMLGMIRTVCLTFIMIRAGFQLTTTPLGRYSFFLVKLAILPCTIEGICITICCKYLLKYPWNWSALAGTVIACMSPVVTINCILALAEKGYGEAKGLATLLSTAAIIDNIFVVAVFYIIYSFIFHYDLEKPNVRSTESLKWGTYTFQSFRDLFLGIVAGVGFGLFLIFFPHRSHKYVTCYRLIGLVCGALTCTLLASKLTISVCGFLAVFVLSFIAITGWRILTVTLDMEPFRKVGSIMWHFMQPVLLGVIGADIDFRGWSVSRFGLHFSIIVIGLTMRSATAALTTCKTTFSWKERLFMVISWLPKGTLQAALAPMAFEGAGKDNDPEKIELALDIVNLSVIVIIFLAPIGAFAMTKSGPLLLEKCSTEEQERERELSYIRIISLQPQEN